MMLRNRVRLAQFSAVNFLFGLLKAFAVGNRQCSGFYFKPINQSTCLFYSPFTKTSDLWTYTNSTMR